MSRAVIDAMTSSFGAAWGNPTSIHSEGRLARSVVEGAREKAAAMAAGRTALRTTATRRSLALVVRFAGGDLSVGLAATRAGSMGLEHLAAG